MKNVGWVLVVCGWLLTTCQQSDPNGYSRVDDPYEVAAITDDHINMIVEIPAGTNHKLEFDAEKNEFVHDTNEDGSTRMINFLPYPGNYGFIPGTLMDKARGGDGDPLDVLVISEAAVTGSMIPIIPIGALLLRDRGELDTKIIAIPAAENKRVLRATDFLDFAIRFDPAKQIIENWFLNYKGPGQTELIRWEDETYAWEAVRKWKVATEPSPQ
ncbi:MAG: inorganic diphosphatase [Bacteroidota bacterium]